MNRFTVVSGGKSVIIWHGETSFEIRKLLRKNYRIWFCLFATSVRERRTGRERDVLSLRASEVGKVKYRAVAKFRNFFSLSFFSLSISRSRFTPLSYSLSYTTCRNLLSPLSSSALSSPLYLLPQISFVYFTVQRRSLL